MYCGEAYHCPQHPLWDVILPAAMSNSPILAVYSRPGLCRMMAEYQLHHQPSSIRYGLVQREPNRHTIENNASAMPPAFIYRILAVLVSILPLGLRAKIWIKLARRGGWPAESKAQRLPGGMYIKYGSDISRNEGEVMRHVRSHSTVPVPVVVDNFTYGDCTYLVMSRLPGESLAGAYFDITPEVELLLSAQLSKILASLRAIPAPSQRVSGWGGSPVYCERICLGAYPAGPWDSVDDFHKELMLRALPLNIPEDVNAEEVNDVIRRAHSRRHRICLTHNDLGPHNVLVDDKWNITGIVDWEVSAWMPEYWELTKGTFLPQYRKHRWYRILTSAVPMYALEQDAERYIISYREHYM